MKSTIVKIIALITVIIISGCDNPRHPTCWWDDCDDCYDYYCLPAPCGVYSVTGDRSVRLYWNPIRNACIDYYRVWRGYSERGSYYLIGETNSAQFVDWDVVNGVTYYYAVSAVDCYGYESELSDELVFDTPRPEGYGERVFIAESYPDDAGFDFSSYSVVPFDYYSADVYFSSDGHNYYMVPASSATDLLVYGPTETLSGVDWAPEHGWINDEVVLWEGYSYLVWTADNHFAHVRITTICGDRIYFDWAYQIDEGNPELAMPKFDEKQVREAKLNVKKESLIPEKAKNQK